MSDMVDHPAPRVSVSRDILRAELAEMELRLRIWIAAELEEKASAADLEHLKGIVAARSATMDAMAPLRDRLVQEHNDLMSWRKSAYGGEFTRAQEAAMELRAKEVLAAQMQTGFSRRERFIALVAITLSVIVAAVNLAETWGVI